MVRTRKRLPPTISLSCLICKKTKHLVAFPTKKTLLRKWIKALKLAEVDTEKDRICINHFKASDLVNSSTPKPNAVPFLPSAPAETTTIKKESKKAQDNTFETVLIPERSSVGLSTNKIDSFTALTANWTLDDIKGGRPDWFYQISDEFVLFYKLNAQLEPPIIENSFKITKELQLSCFSQRGQLDQNRLSGALQCSFATSNICLSSLHKLMDFFDESAKNSRELATTLEEIKYGNIKSHFEANLKICRFCFLQEAQTRNRMLKYITLETQNLFRVACDKEMNKKGRFPPQVCLDCLERLREVAEFKGNVLDAEVVLSDFKKALVPGNEEASDQDDGFAADLDPKIEEYDDEEMLEGVGEDPPTVVQEDVMPSADEVGGFMFEQLQKFREMGLRRVLLSDGTIREECVKCSKIFQNMSYLSSHFISRSHMTPQQLVEHEQSFIDEAVSKGLQITEFNDGSVKYECVRCTVEFTNKNSMKNHFVRTHGDASVRCGLCDKSFYDKGTLQRHLKQVHDDIQLECPECGGLFNEHRMKTHLKTHRPLDFICDQCSQRFRSKSLLEAHMKRRHVANPQFYCEFCPESFGAEIFLLRHIHKSHQDCIRTDYLCNKCGRFFLRSTSLVSHQRWCQVDFSERQTSRPHQRLAPDPQRETTSTKTPRPRLHLQYECSICSKKFSLKRYLDEHFKKHRNEARPFVCQICHASYTRRAHLEVHISSVHTKDFKFKCIFCDRGFALKPELREHEMMHTGERPWACTEPGCSFSTNRKRNLKSHMLKHSTKFYRCPICTAGLGNEKLLRTLNSFTLHMKVIHPTSYDPEDDFDKYLVERDAEQASQLPRSYVYRTGGGMMAEPVNEVIIEACEVTKEEGEEEMEIVEIEPFY